MRLYDWILSKKDGTLKRKECWNYRAEYETLAIKPVTAEMLEQYVRDGTEAWRDQANKYWYQIKELQKENELLRTKLEWLMKQPALQHYNVDLALTPPIEVKENVEPKLPEKWEGVE